MAVSRSELEIILNVIKQGGGIQQIETELQTLGAQTGGATGATAGLTQGMQGLQSVLSTLGLALTVQQLVQFANASREAARAETDSINTLKAAAGTTVDYQQALNLGREATMGMVSDQQIASSETTLLGAKLASTAQEAAQLTSAGAILSGVFSNVGGSMEKFNMLLSSGSPMLLNNFGLTKEMVAAKQKEIEATTGLNGEEAKQQALKEILIAQAQKYKGALSEDTIQAKQAEAASQNFSASFGTLINEMDKATGSTTFLTASMVKLTEGARAWGTVIQGTEAILAQEKAATEASGALDNYRMSMGGITQAQIEAEHAARSAANAQQEAGEAATATAQAAADELAALGPLVSSLDAMGFSAAGAAEGQDPLIAKLNEARFAADQAAEAFTHTAAAQQSMAQAAAFGGQSDAFSQSRQLAGLQAADDMSKASRDKKAAEEAAAADASERQAKVTATATVKAFDGVGTQIATSISSAVSGAVSQNNSDVIGKLLGIDTAGANTGEAVRRMAAVAAGGITDQWAPELAAQLTGVNDETAKAFVAAFSKGDNTALKASAQKLALSPIVEMFDAQAIANQVEAKLKEGQLTEALNAKVNALLGAKGLPAVKGVTDQVGQAVTTTGDAVTAVSGQVADVATAAKTAGADMAGSTDAYEAGLKRIIALLLRVLGLTDEWNSKTKAAGASFDTIGAGASANGTPTQAQQKMGPTRGL